MYTGALEMDDLIFPAIVDAEFLRQVTRQLIGGLKRVLVAECMVCMDVDI